MGEVKWDISSQELVILKEYNSINEAEIARSFLESAGISSTINNEYMSMFYPIGVIYPQILVRREDYERANALLEG